MDTKKKYNKLDLVGRDHTKGMTSFKTGAILTKKDKKKNRKTKEAKREIRKALNDE